MIINSLFQPDDFSIGSTRIIFCNQFFNSSMMSLESISDEWSIEICWTSQFFEIFAIKKCAAFSLFVQGSMTV